jgi:GWxTD domain-containing protein
LSTNLKTMTVKTLLCSIIISIVHCVPSFSIQVDVSNYVFRSDKSYAEVYIRVDGKSVQWQQKNDKNYASIDAIMIFKDDKDVIIAYEKFTFKSPGVDTISDVITVRRSFLPHGLHKMYLEVIDSYDAENKIELEQKVNISTIVPTDIVISDIIPCGSVKPDLSDAPSAKNGLNIEPLPFHYIDETRTQLDFYLEVYKPEGSSPMYLKYFIQEKNKTLTISDLTPSKVKKLNENSTEALVLSLPIKTYLSGDYDIIAQVLNHQKVIVATQRSSITISNPTADLAHLENYNDNAQNSFVQQIKDDELVYILRAHVPVIEQMQSATLETLINTNNPRSQRQFIYQYWKKNSTANPEVGYKAYMEVAKAVDKKFYSNVGFGFQSDRGHIFLKHGKPSNVITVDTEVDAPPYEIWYYQQTYTTSQTNVRFLFYNPSLAHNDFQLLHSTCLGERTNPAWERTLYKSIPREIIGNTVDATQVQDNFNRNARRYFNDF